MLFGIPPLITIAIACIKLYVDSTVQGTPFSTRLAFIASVLTALWLLFVLIWKVWIAYEEDANESPEIVHEGLYAAVSTLQVMLSHYCKKRGHSGEIRATFHRVVPPADAPTQIEQIIPYAGTTTNGIGRKFSLNTGITGQAIRRRKPIAMSSKKMTEAEHRHELIESWGYTDSQAAALTQGRYSAAALPVLNSSGQYVLGVLYLDSSEHEIFDRPEVQEIVTVGSAAISDFVTKRY